MPPPILHRPSRRGLPPLVICWFLVNAVLLLLPPVHWAVNASRASVIGMPATLFYFVGLSVSITASVVVAYLQESAQGDLE